MNEALDLLECEPHVVSASPGQTGVLRPAVWFCSTTARVRVFKPAVAFDLDSGAGIAVAIADSSRHAAPDQENSRMTCMAQGRDQLIAVIAYHPRDPSHAAGIGHTCGRHMHR